MASSGGARETGGVDGTDRRLVRGYLRDRSEEAFRALYRRHAPSLWPFALRLCRGREDEAEDVMQETWLRAARSRARRRRREDAVAEVEGGEGAADVDLAHVDRVALARALDRISDGQREALLLHDVHGYTHREVAGMLGIEPGSSRARVSRGRAALRSILAGGGST